jgi:SAM-dependent methyltransferase
VVAGSNSSSARRLIRRVRALREGLRYRLLAWKHQANRGYCPTCESRTWFVEEQPWKRDYYRCVICGSIPRYRLLVHVLNEYFKGWEDQRIHECSPGGAASRLIRTKCRNYSSSHYFEDVPRGEYRGEHRSEDLSDLTFSDASLDLFITQDVFEHVIDPASAFKEICRVLKPGGAHVFTVPWYPQLKENRVRARVENGRIIHVEEPIYHRNPISSQGSLVTTDWGIRFPDFVYQESGMFTTVIKVRDRWLGLDAEFREVFVSRKPH